MVPADPTRPDNLLPWLTAARWFAGKGRQPELRRLTRLPWLTPASAWPAVRFEIAEIGYPGESAESYSLPTAYWPTPQPGQAPAALGRLTDPDLGALVAYDAAQDPAACRVLLAALLGGRRVGAGEEEVTLHPRAPEGLTPDLEPRLYRGEQSNTSVMFGEVAMLKLFRRLEPGRNLDIDIHEALRDSPHADLARLYGWVEARWIGRDGPMSADLGMLVEKLADAVDGWELALDSLRRGRAFAGASQLGYALSQTHAALRQAFPTGQQDGALVAEQMTQRLTAAVAHAPPLAEHADRLRALFAEVAASELLTQRVHGDFHLGQTLHTPDGWKIIDFEGEPAKSLADRAAPDSAWRDVAGMLRSFAYAAASVPGARAPTWAATCREAFLTAYVGGPLGPDEARVVAAYEADKAVYEVVYEVRNRPDWVKIPLSGLAALAASTPAVPTV